MFPGRDRTPVRNRESGGPGGGKRTPAEAQDLEYDGQGNILIGRRRFAVGLSWEPLRTDMTLHEQASRMRRAGFVRDLVVRNGDQVGFGSSETLHRRSTPVLALNARRDLLGDTWVAAFRLSQTSDFHWVVAMRDGDVFEDSVLPNEAEARDILLENLDAPGWNRVIAPSDWAIEGSEEGGVERFFSLRGGPKLGVVNRRREILLRILALLVLSGLLAGAWYAWSEYQARERERERQLREAQSAAVRIDPMTHPWVRAPRPGPFIEACEIGFSRMVLKVPGWNQSVLSCAPSGDGVTIDVSWGRTPNGRFSWLMAAAGDGLIPVEPRLDTGGNRAHARHAVPVSEQMHNDPFTTWIGSRIEQTLRPRFQTLGLPVLLQENARVVTRSEQERMTRPVYNHHVLTIETSVALQEYVDLLSDVPAIVPVQLEYDPSTLAWRLRINIHHPPILPLPPASTR